MRLAAAFSPALAEEKWGQMVRQTASSRRPDQGSRQS